VLTVFSRSLRRGRRRHGRNQTDSELHPYTYSTYVHPFRAPTRRLF
jgi:hypothetical protein